LIALAEEDRDDYDGNQNYWSSIMKAVVKKEGVLIPRKLLKGAKQVEIRKEPGRIVVLPIPAPDDPVFKLGKHPVKSGVSDASERPDEYLYPGA